MDSDSVDNLILEYLYAEQGEFTGYYSGQLSSDVKDLYWAFPKGTDQEFHMSRLRSLYDRDLIEGCTCGCKGNFEITDKGISFLGKTRIREGIRC